IEVSGNDVFSAQNGAGLFIEFSNNLTIDGNNLANVSRGLSIWSSTNTTVRANHLFGTGISVHGTDLVHFVTHTFGTDNTVNGLPFVGYRNCNDVTIDGAAVAEVFLSECKRVHIRGLTLDGSEMGIMLAAVDDALVEGNNFSSISSEAAIQVFGGTNVSLRSNYITGSGGGLLVSNARDVSLVGNTMDRNSIGAVESSDLDGSVLGYHWDFGDGTEGYGVYVYHTFAMPGRYTVTLTVTDNSELTNTSTALFTVRLSTEEPIASFDANVPQPLF